jgi:hypothetical protein
MMECGSCSDAPTTLHCRSARWRRHAPRNWKAARPCQDVGGLPRAQAQTSGVRGAVGMRRRVRHPGSAQWCTSRLRRHDRLDEHRPAHQRTFAQPCRRGVASARLARRREAGRWNLTLPGRRWTLTLAGGCRGLELRCGSCRSYPSRSTGLQRTIGRCAPNLTLQVSRTLCAKPARPTSRRSGSTSVHTRI